MKNKLLLYLILGFCCLYIAISCEGKQIRSNDFEISQIDSISISKQVLGLKIDSTQSVLDTISLTFYKYDTEGNKRYVKRTYYFADADDMVSESYYTEQEDLFYQTQKLHTNDWSIFETFRYLNENIQKAYQIHPNSENGLDTLIIDYHYENYFLGGKKTRILKTNQTEIDEFTLKTTYDRKGKKQNEIQLIGKDTFSIEMYSYKQGKLDIARYNKIFGDKVERTSWFNEKEHRIKSDQKVFIGDSLITWEVVNFDLDSKGEIIFEETKDKIRNEIEYIRYETINKSSNDHDL